jgi:ABC-type transporter Mla MlaB component
MLLNQETVTLATLTPAIAQVLAAIQAGDTVLDLAKVGKVDSSILSLLLHAQRALPKGKALTLQNPPAQMHGLAEAYGVQSLF